MKKIIYLLLLFLNANSAAAHNPQVSTVSFIQNENNQWSVYITAPLYTYQLAIQKNKPNLKIDSIDALNMQKYIFELVKNNFIINDNNSIPLINEKIQLAHETTVYFDIANTIKTFTPNSVHFSAFDKLENHFTLLKIVSKNGKQIHYILNTDNQFSYPLNKIKDMSIVNFFDKNKYIEVVSRIGVRYILITGTIFFLFYILFKRSILYK